MYGTTRVASRLDDRWEKIYRHIYPPPLLEFEFSLSIREQSWLKRRTSFLSRAHYFPSIRGRKLFRPTFHSSDPSFGTPFLGNTEGERMAEHGLFIKLALATVSNTVKYTWKGTYNCHLASDELVPIVDSSVQTETEEIPIRRSTNYPLQ
jgi:hypothetical protein